MTNLTPEAIEHLTDEDLTELPLDTQRAIFEQIAEQTAYLAKAKRRIVAAVEAKFADELVGINTGTVTVERGDSVVTITRPKSVSWDQEALMKAEDVLRHQWGEHPSEYIDTKRSVSETKYQAWPEKIRALFEGARTVKAGATAIKFKDPK